MVFVWLCGVCVLFACTCCLCGVCAVLVTAFQTDQSHWLVWNAVHVVWC